MGSASQKESSRKSLSDKMCCLTKVVFVSFMVFRVQAANAGCPLNLNGLNFTEAVSACSEVGRGRCCRYINALVEISIARYANGTGQLEFLQNRMRHASVPCLTPFNSMVFQPTQQHFVV